MKKEIFVYERDEDVLKFLKYFFKGKDAYSARFIKERDILKQRLKKKAPDVLIIGSTDGLRHLTSSEIQCPIIAVLPPVKDDKTVGAGSAVKPEVDCYLLSPFHKDDLDNKLMTAVKGQHWFDIFYREKKDLQAIIELTSIISSTLNPKEVLYHIVKKLSEIVQLTRCSMISINADNQRFANIVSSFEDPSITNLKIDLRKYPEIKKALSVKKLILIKDAQRDPLMKEVRDIIAPIGIRSIIVVPVIFRDEVIGSLLLRTSRAGHSFTKREIKLCTAFANSSAHALYNAFLYESLDKEKSKIERLAITDYLTGVYNIRYFYNRLQEEFSRAERYKIPLSCIMFDIDYFKKINDTYGHRVGDMVLREFAQFVKTRTRKSDVFARYGGEEFIMLLPQTTAKGALSEAERLKEAVGSHRFHADHGEIRIAISMGISCSPHKKIKNYDDLINSADNSLYVAKAKGRDRIVVTPS